MTYREMMERDNPLHCGERFVGGCYACPGDWYPGGPTDNERCVINDQTADNEAMIKGCAACWDQEVKE